MGHFLSSGGQYWSFNVNISPSNDAEAEIPIFWPPDVKN